MGDQFKDLLVKQSKGHIPKRTLSKRLHTFQKGHIPKKHFQKEHIPRRAHSKNDTFKIGHISKRTHS